MTRFFRRETVATPLLVAMLTGLALLNVPAYSRTDSSVTNKLLRTLHKDELNREAREQQTAGYYEGLLNEGSRVSGMNALITGNDRFDPEFWMRPGRRHRGDFLYWDMPPNLDSRDPDDPRFDHATNSLGMADKEYTIEKPPNTWRVALLGDSITRGQGAPFGTNYEFLLEDQLNQSCFGTAGQGLELLNFAVGGYRITQLVDVAVERVPPFAPDTYVVPLSELSVFRQWGHHLATLVQNGIDLKYDYLRRMAADAGLRPSDPVGTMDAKLARFRLPTLRWALEEMRAAAARQNANIVVILLGNVNDLETLEDQFVGVRPLLDELQLRYIDVLDAFADVEDPGQYSAAEGDTHPNALGHRLLFERLYSEIRRDPALVSLFCGPGATLRP